MKSMMKEQICQSRLLYQFEHGGRFVLRRKVYRENEERVEMLMYRKARKKRASCKSVNMPSTSHLRNTNRKRKRREKEKQMSIFVNEWNEKN